MRETSKERKTRRRSAFKSAFAKVRKDIEQKKKGEIELKLIKAKSIPRISPKKAKEARRDIFAKLRKEREWELLKERVFNEITKNEPLKIKRLQSEQKREDRNSTGMKISPRTRFKAQVAKGTAYF